MNESYKSRIRNSIDRARWLRECMLNDPRPAMRKYLKKSMLHQQEYTRALRMRMQGKLTEVM